MHWSFPVGELVHSQQDVVYAVCKRGLRLRGVVGELIICGESSRPLLSIICHWHQPFSHISPKESATFNENTVTFPPIVMAVKNTRAERVGACCVSLVSFSHVDPNRGHGQSFCLIMLYRPGCASSRRCARRWQHQILIFLTWLAKTICQDERKQHHACKHCDTGAYSRCFV